MVRWPDAKCEVTRKEKKSREAKKKRRKEKRSREERRDLLETKQVEKSHFTEGKVQQKHIIANIPIRRRANKTEEKH